ncbi:MAG TPA: hypothetical protein VGS22_27975 [Thermoanaerobaculia bacterium]|jgi:hypothetical protein|nr:hypothetical protein [Thermoanaerobaculia bacterium]
MIDQGFYLPAPVRFLEPNDRDLAQLQRDAKVRSAYIDGLCCLHGLLIGYAPDYGPHGPGEGAFSAETLDSLVAGEMGTASATLMGPNVRAAFQLRERARGGVVSEALARTEPVERSIARFLDGVISTFNLVRTFDGGWSAES